MAQTPREIFKIPITWTNNVSQPILVSDFKNINLTVVGTGAVSVLGSKDVQVDPINFASPSTISNSYATTIILDETVAPVAGATTLTVAGATKIGRVDTNTLTWIALSRNLNTVDAFITISDNQ